MDTLSPPVALHSSHLKTKVYATDLRTAFQEYVDHIKILSLDCFDTLLWRKTATPRDLFFDFNHHPLLQAQGFSAQMRIRGEELASRLKQLKTGSSQINLSEIYRAALPLLNDTDINTLVEHELAVEIETCFIFQPVLELIKLAKKQNKKIIIVSDTYLQEAQLRKLLASKLPQEIMESIDRIFCSCDMGLAKAEGLFKLVINKMNVSANEILHLGDNPVADFNAPRASGVNALHFIQHSPMIAEMLRTQTVAAGFLDSSIHNSRSLTSPFRGLFALETSEKPEALIGYAGLGPIMYAFARFICDEVEALRVAGKKPKVLFLLRDAYLPSLACEAIIGKPIGANARISRFTAIASSLRTQADVDIYLAENISSLRFKDMCAQLLLPHDLTEKILKKTNLSSRPMHEFLRLINQESTLKIIFNESNAYWLRLKKYLENQITLEAGDTLVFVDLGYTGTTQIKLAPIFQKEMNIEVVGRYLIGLRTSNWLATRKGLFDAHHYDDSVLSMFVTSIALIEQLSTSSEQSSIDFDKNGNVKFAELAVDKQQLDKLKEIQTECVRFIHDAEKFLETSSIQLSNSVLRDTAALSLARIIFLPTSSELTYLQTFKHDVNLGTDAVIPVFDVEKGLQGLRQRSWLFCQKENFSNMRMNYPAEWRAVGLEFSITLMAQQRFGFHVALNDLSHLRENIDILAPQGTNITTIAFEAFPTHNGYFSLTIPIIAGSQFGVRLGAKYQWVELESADMIALQYLYSKYEDLHTEDGSQFLALEQMNDKGGGLFECLSPDGLLLFVAPKKLTSNSHVLRIIFRPIVRRVL